MTNTLKSYTAIRKDIKEFIKTIPPYITLVAATKYFSAEQMRELYEDGITNFGENRVDSFLNKHNQLSNLQINWHFIGHLQRNKAKDVINKIDYLHSLDSLKLAEVIEKYREKPLECFIEVSVNREENKNGVDPKDLINFTKQLLSFSKIKIVGLMMMAIEFSEHDELMEQFSHLTKLRDKLENELKIKIPYLSMGMSDDYLEAIECGATHIRLGRILTDTRL